MSAEDAIKTTVDELLKVISARNIIGEPIEMEDKVVLPITKMGMGFGTGIGPGSEEKCIGGIAGGAGGGVGVNPIALVIIFKGISGPEGVKVVPLTTTSAVSESVSEIATSVLGRLTGRKEEGETKHEKSSVPVKIE